MARARRSVFGKSSVDTSELQELATQLEIKRNAIVAAFQRVQPEFGAYMAYSLWLEIGTKKMLARPHIMPAIKGGRAAVVSEQGKAIKTILGMKNVTFDAAEKEIAKAWTRALMGPIRQDAVARATSLKIVQYGFHRRSIYGGAYARSQEEINAIQRDAETQRKVLSKAAAARVAKKKAKKKPATKKKPKG